MHFLNPNRFVALEREGDSGGGGDRREVFRLDNTGQLFTARVSQPTGSITRGAGARLVQTGGDLTQGGITR